MLLAYVGLLSSRAIVARTARRLDQLKSDWYLKVDVNELDLEDDSRCILTQLYGSYGQGCMRLGIDPGRGHLYGFYGQLSPQNYLLRMVLGLAFNNGEESIDRATRAKSNRLADAWLDEIEDRYINDIDTELDTMKSKVESLSS